MVHWRDAGWVEELVSVRLRLTVDPGVPLPEESARVTPCAKAELPRATNRNDAIDGIRARRRKVHIALGRNFISHIGKWC